MILHSPIPIAWGLSVSRMSKNHEGFSVNTHGRCPPVVEIVNDMENKKPVAYQRFIRIPKTKVKSKVFRASFLKYGSNAALPSNFLMSFKSLTNSGKVKRKAYCNNAACCMLRKTANNTNGSNTSRL